MKKIFAALILSALCVVPVAASADQLIALPIRSENLMWRHSLAAQLGGYADSASTTLTAGGTNFDTTQTWIPAKMSQTGVGLVGNGTAFGAAKVFVTTTNTAGDSLYLWIDQSVDGVNWSAPTAAINMLGGTTTKQLTVPLTLKLDAVATAAASWGLAPYIRFRIQSDSATTCTGARIWIAYFGNESN